MNAFFPHAYTNLCPCILMLMEAKNSRGWITMKRSNVSFDCLALVLFVLLALCCLLLFHIQNVTF